MKEGMRLPIGAEVFPEGVYFRVWAPYVQTIEVVLENDSDRHAYSLKSEENGYFSGLVSEAVEGSLYRFRLNGEENLYPDPASRYQPNGPHGSSQVVDPHKFKWSDAYWKGPPKEGRVIYEMHVGTFTQQGTWQSAKAELLELADLGITIIEMMPVNEFPGRFGWGYDGVNLFAPTHLYGIPDDLREFIDHAHSVGIAVILDVVYNHFGPDGNYLGFFSKDYFTDHHKTEWGDAINFDGENSSEVRRFFIANAGYWIEEFHFDGLRIDAAHAIVDDSPTHILAEVNQQVRQKAAPRKTYIVGEHEGQDNALIRPVEEGGYGLDAVWNDDYHHSVMVRLTGRKEGYYADYLGNPQEFISALKYGYLYQGQWYLWQHKNRGTPGLHFNTDRFINFIQNHDQIANSAHGKRIHLLTDPGNYRAMTALLLLAPNTPMLFQGQEFAALSPFYYFADQSPELAKLIAQGRLDTFKKFASIGTPEMQAIIPEPGNMETFLKCKLNFIDRQSHAQEYDLHRDLLRIRHHDHIFSIPYAGQIDGAVLSQDAFILRFFGEGDDARLMLVNFGVDLPLSPLPDPLFAPPAGQQWRLMWSSEDHRYGGNGTPPLWTDQRWVMVGHSVMILIPQ